MSNVNVISRYVGAGTPAQGTNVMPVTLLTTNTETLINNQTGNPAVIYPQPTGQFTSTTFGNGFDGFPIKVRAAFKVSNTVASSTAIVAIYANQVSTTITSGNKLATVTSQSLGGTGSTSGVLEAFIIWDSVGQTISGYQHGYFGTTLLAPAALTNTAVSITALSSLNFSITATCGTTGKSVSFYITEFVVETV